MKFKYQLLLLVLSLNLILFILVVLLFREQNMLFIIGEIVLLISTVFSVRIIRKTTKPIDLITAGTEFIKENDFNTKFASSNNSELDSMMQVYNQMIEKLRNERILQKEQYHFLDKIIKASPSGIILMDLDQKIISMNPAAEHITGFTNNDVAGKKTNEIQHLIFKEISNMDLNESIITISGIQNIRCQKSHFIDRSFTRFFILLEEISSVTLDTEKKALEKVIRMMSHEVNNSIGPINSILESTLNYGKYLSNEDKIEFQNIVNVAIERNKHLNYFTSNFADVVNIPSPKLGFCNLNGLLDNQKPLLEKAYGTQINMKWDLATPSPMIDVDSTQFEQVIHNIYKNAAEAMSGKGIIITRTFNSPASLTITDNGTGIPDHVKNKLFTPFFSTKKNGQGIGLMLIREILRNHGFKFSLETSKENLTEFRIDFNINQRVTSNN